MERLLYDKSVSYQGYLIIPFLFRKLASEPIYSYALISDQGYKDQFNEATNPAELYSSNLIDIIQIAQQHLDTYVGVEGVTKDYFQNRYTYRNNLIVVHQEGGKCFYDHYPPNQLKNIAAPKLFLTVNDCITWVKAGLDRDF